MVLNVTGLNNGSKKHMMCGVLEEKRLLGNKKDLFGGLNLAVCLKQVCVFVG